MKYNRKSFVLSIITFLFIGFSHLGFAQDTPKKETGNASWYGSKYHGKKTSSGERYNKNDMTAAHNTLPFGTKVKVTNLDNNESVIVRINDRGPYVGHRIIDVSEVAARKLGIREQGVGKVQVEVLSDNYNPQHPNHYTIQINAFKNLKNAQAQTQKLKEFDKHLSIEMTEEVVKGKKIHLLKVGKFEKKQHAEAFNELLKDEGLGGEVSGV